MQLYKGQTRAKPHGPALLQPDEPRTQYNPHNNYITAGQEPPQDATNHAHPLPRTTQCLSRTLQYAVEVHCSL